MAKLAKRKQVKKSLEQLTDGIIVQAEPVRAVRQDQELECRVCHNAWIVVGSNVTSVVCDHCVALMVGPPEGLGVKKEVTGFPRGWHLKKLFISKDGVPFSKGVEITKEEAKIIKAEIKDNPPAVIRKKKVKIKLDFGEMIEQKMREQTEKRNQRTLAGKEGNIDSLAESPVKRKRGRPRKN